MVGFVHDVAIIGAGPAGATLATFLRRYRPDTSVVVLEKQPFPRHQIGESLLIDVNRILADMGALEAVEAAGFSKKLGATFVWGAERDVYSFLWREGQAITGGSGHSAVTWHVDRPRYDAILADCARQQGADVREGWAVTDVLRDGDRVVGVAATDPDGQRQDVPARWVIDCAGDRGPVHRTLGHRRLDAELRNVAVFGYLRGVGFRDDLNGSDDARRTAILTHDDGWVWVIPLAGGIASVGFVTADETYRRDKHDDLRAYYWDKLRALPEHDDLFSGAELYDYRGDQRMVHAVSEFSYQCDDIWGPGWVTCGNAAGFVDAILSIGVFVAQNHAQFLACAIATILDGDADESTALESYATSVRENLDAFRAVAHMFYAFNTTPSEWWRACSAELADSTFVPDAADRDAFLAFFTGFSARSAIYDQAVNALGGSFLEDVGEQLFGDQPVFRDRAIGRAASDARDLVRADPALAADAIATRPFMLPDLATGRMRNVARLEWTSEGRHRRLYVVPPFDSVPDLLDGSRTLSDVTIQVAARGGLELHTARDEVLKLAYRLVCMGAARAATPR
jgi:halogenation protein CepH